MTHAVLTEALDVAGPAIRTAVRRALARVPACRRPTALLEPEDLAQAVRLSLLARLARLPAAPDAPLLTRLAWHAAVDEVRRGLGRGPVHRPVAQALPDDLPAGPAPPDARLRAAALLARLSDAQGRAAQGVAAGYTHGELAARESARLRRPVAAGTIASHLYRARRRLAVVA